MSGPEGYLEILKIVSQNVRTLLWNVLIVGIVWVVSQIVVQIYSHHKTLQIEKSVRQSQTLRALVESGSKVAALLAVASKDATNGPNTTVGQSLIEFETLYWGTYGLMSEPKVEACFTVLRRELRVAAEGFSATPRGSNTEVHLQRLCLRLMLRPNLWLP